MEYNSNYITMVIFVYRPGHSELDSINEILWTYELGLSFLFNS